MTTGVLSGSERVTDDLTATRAPSRPALERVPEVVRRRLQRPRFPDLYFWLTALFITAIGGALRLWNLSHPPEKIFDELYYADEARDLLGHAVEWNPDDNTPEYVVHPPLGKWLIAVGEQIFGYNSLGWRVVAALFGTVSILLVIVIAQRLFRSTILAAAAGLLMSLDGMHFVMSRVALLDIFLMFFIVVSFGCLVLDREQTRAKWLRFIAAGGDPSRPGRAGRPPFQLPWWKLAAGATIGLACGVKWSGIWYVFIFGALALLWEAGARRSAGVRRWWTDTLLEETPWLLAALGLAVVCYLATWTGWFATDDGYFRHYWSTVHHTAPGGPIDALMSLWHYHSEAYKFHTTLTVPHRYQSWPWQWLLLGRPVAFYWSTSGNCGTTNCASEILLLGTPVLWWSFLPALLGMAWLGIARRDWRALAIGLGVAGGIVPWFWSELGDRTMFYFYALPSEPFLVLAVCYVLGAIMGPAKRVKPHSDQRLIGAVIAGVYLLLVAACFAYFYPIYAGGDLTYQQWYARMWLGGRWV